MAEEPPSIEACLAQLKRHLDPAAAQAIEQLNAAINARVDRLTHAVEGPSPWLEVGRDLLRQVNGRAKTPKPKPVPKPKPKPPVVEKPASPPPAPAPAPVVDDTAAREAACRREEVERRRIEAERLELEAAAARLQASERGRAARKRRKKAPKPKQVYATGRKIENKKPSTHAEHELLLPLETVRAVVVRLHEAFPKVRDRRPPSVAAMAWGRRTRCSHRRAIAATLFARWRRGRNNHTDTAPVEKINNHPTRRSARPGTPRAP